jgi:hypothetical protein
LPAAARKVTKEKPLKVWECSFLFHSEKKRTKETPFKVERVCVLN